jgi:hypothetical protein
MSPSASILTSQELDHGVRRDWLENERIMVLTMPEHADRPAVDAWFDIMIEVGNLWDMSEPFLVLHDIREMGFSQYFRDRAIELGKHTPTEITGRGAVVLPRSVVGTLLSIAARISTRRIQTDFELKIFTDYDKALDWLKEGF